MQTGVLVVPEPGRLVEGDGEEEGLPGDLLGEEDGRGHRLLVPPQLRPGLPHPHVVDLR